jgi:hypothetical protein
MLVCKRKSQGLRRKHLKFFSSFRFLVIISPICQGSDKSSNGSCSNQSNGVEGNTTRYSVGAYSTYIEMSPIRASSLGPYFTTLPGIDPIQFEFLLFCLFKTIWQVVLSEVLIIYIQMGSFFAFSLSWENNNCVHWVWSVKCSTSLQVSTQRKKVSPLFWSEEDEHWKKLCLKKQGGDFLWKDTWKRTTLLERNQFKPFPYQKLAIQGIIFSFIVLLTFGTQGFNSTELYKAWYRSTVPISQFSTVEHQTVDRRSKLTLKEFIGMISLSQWRFFSWFFWSYLLP